MCNDMASDTGEGDGTRSPLLELKVKLVVLDPLDALNRFLERLSASQYK